MSGAQRVRNGCRKFFKNIVQMSLQGGAADKEQLTDFFMAVAEQMFFDHAYL